MKKLSVITGTALVAIWLAVDAVRDFIEYDTIGYFRAHPWELLNVVTLAALSGLAAFLYDRLPASRQRHVRMLSWGAGASILTVFITYYGFRVAEMRPLGIELQGTLWMLIALMLFSGIAAYLWWECIRAWRSRPSE